MHFKNHNSNRYVIHVIQTLHPSVTGTRSGGKLSTVVTARENLRAYSSWYETSMSKMKEYIGNCLKMPECIRN